MSIEISLTEKHTNSNLWEFQINKKLISCEE